MPTSKLAASVALAIAACLFYYFVYPTSYLYVAKNGVAYRVNRYMGKQDMSVANQGWVSMDAVRQQKELAKRESATASDEAKAELLKAWESVKFYTDKGSLGVIWVSNPTSCKFTLQIDAPLAYFKIDPTGRPGKRLSTTRALIGQEITANGDVKLPLVVGGEPGYPQQVLDAVADGERILQRVTIQLAGGETPDGKRTRFSSGTPDRQVDRTFTPYPG